MNMQRQDWPSIEAENGAELLAYLGTAACATSHRAADLTWVVTGVAAPDYNGVLWARLSKEDADDQVPALVQQFRFQGLPAIWRVDPASEPEDLSDRLRTLGCVPVEERICMGATLTSLAREMSRFPGLTVDRAVTADELTDWLDVWATITSEPRAPREQLYSALDLGARQPLHHYVARIDGRPAGVAQLFLGQRAAGLHTVGVAPAFRGRGIGTALVLTPLMVARTLGYDVAVVRPERESRSMYEHLGFETLTQPSIGFLIGSES
jgi:GNAT superfamily N-acetyltransferase